MLTRQLDCREVATTLYKSRYHRLPIPHFVLPKFSLVPPLPLQRSRQHGRNLIDQKSPRRVTLPAAHRPEPRPLNPLTKIMRIQHISEQPVLRNHIHLLHAFDGLARLLGFGALLAVRRTTNLAEVVVVEGVGEEAPGPYYEAEFHGPVAALPVLLGGGPVAGEPSADGDGVEDLKERHAEAEDGVHGRHAWVEEERGEDGAVEVVDYLYTGWSVCEEESGQALGTYETRGHRPVAPRQCLDALLLRERKHDVQERDEAHGFRDSPPPFAGDVDARVVGCFAHRIPVEHPLERCNLHMCEP
jgi:hypothetical protein